MRLDDALAGVTRLAFDTSPVIYFVEADSRYDALVTEVFRRVDGDALEGITSIITLVEVLVHPLQRGDIALERQYRDLLLTSRNFRVLGLDRETAGRAAVLRARHGLRTPDALQIAAALAANCDAFLTNDVGLQRVSDIRVLVLRDLEA